MNETFKTELIHYLAKSFGLACLILAALTSCAQRTLQASRRPATPAGSLETGSPVEWPKTFKMNPRMEAGHRKRLEAAWATLTSTPTGRDLAKRLERVDEISIEYIFPDNYGDVSSNGIWDDEYKLLMFNEKVLAKWPSEHLAWLMAHELEHVYQSEKAGLQRNGEVESEQLSALKEESALSIEFRVWVELGSPSTAELKSGYQPEFAALRKLSYLAHPRATALVWRLTNSSHVYRKPVREAHPKLRDYYVQAIEAERVWRARNAERLQISAAAGDAAMNALAKERAAKMYPPLKVVGLAVSHEVLDFVEMTDWDFMSGPLEVPVRNKGELDQRMLEALPLVKSVHFKNGSWVLHSGEN